MNISHLIGKKVCVLQYSVSGSVTIIQGKLCKREKGEFVVFSSSLFFFFIKKLFSNRNEDSFIKFPWTAVSECIGNNIFIFDITAEQLTKLVEETWADDLLFDSLNKKNP